MSGADASVLLHALLSDADLVQTPHGPVLVAPVPWPLVDDLCAAMAETEDDEPDAVEEEA